MIKDKYKALTEMAETHEGAVARLYDIIKILRVECPWDRQQDHKSLRPCMIEEAYEVAEAIDNDDADNLREELGDVFLQVVFHSSLAEENKKFTLTDVINEECEKMIRRHPHVFFNEEGKTVDKVLEKWENIKVREHEYRSCTSELVNVPRAFPALIRSGKVQKKALRVGIGDTNLSSSFAQIIDRTEELINANVESNKISLTDKIGELLFLIVHASNLLEVNPEAALEQTTDKFINRFGNMEQEVKEANRSLEQMDSKELKGFWDKTSESSSKG